MPIGMWHPLSGGGVPLNLGNGPVTVEINSQRTAILICYEQLLTWPILSSAIHAPSMLIGIANTHSICHTTIPEIQDVYLRAWAQLFDLEIVKASNR
ncbi:MAG: hypothetical protein QM757_26260 [Paludibaculum sp.]